MIGPEPGRRRGSGHVQRQLHDPLGAAPQSVQQLRQMPPEELLPVQREALSFRPP